MQPAPSAIYPGRAIQWAKRPIYTITALHHLSTALPRSRAQNCFLKNSELSSRQVDQKRDDLRTVTSALFQLGPGEGEDQRAKQTASLARRLTQ